MSLFLLPRILVPDARVFANTLQSQGLLSTMKNMLRVLALQTKILKCGSGFSGAVTSGTSCKFILSTPQQRHVF